MNYPSLEFDTALAALCHGTATDSEVEELHTAIRESQAAQDAYLWHVEVHSQLASTARISATIPAIVSTKGTPAANRRVVRRLGPWQWLAASAVLLALGGTGWMVWRSLGNRSVPDSKTVPIVAEPDAPTPPGNSSASLAGIYRDTIQFAYAADAPIIVGTGQKNPLELGAKVPYSQAGNTLHVWDWSKSPLSRVMPDTRLWSHDIFAVSPDGKQLVWANGSIIDLATGASSKIDLGGAFYLGNAGGQMDRIQHLQFTPDGRRLAIQFLDIVLTKSSHPLRKQDFDTTAILQIVEFPSGKLVCDLPAGLCAGFFRDGERVLTSLPMREMGQQIVEQSTLTGKELRTFKPRLKGFAYAMCLSPTEQHVAVFDSEGEVLIWDAATGELRHRLPMSTNLGACLRIAPNGKLLATSDGKNLSVIDLATGSIVAKMPQFVRSVMIQWSPDSRTITSVSTPYLHEGEEPTGLSNVIPSVERFKVDDYLQK